MQLSPACLGGKGPAPVDQREPSLPHDALRSVFSYLDCCSLCSCSCVCRSWCTLAAEDGLWRMQLTKEFYRPGMLQHYRMLANHHQLLQHHQHEAACCSCRQPAKDMPSAMQAVMPSGLKQVFLEGRVQPSCQHQALLARFHTAMSSIHGWRLMIRMQQPAAAAAGAKSGAAAAPEIANIGQAQQRRHEQTCVAPHFAACDAAAATSSSIALVALTGHPMPLSLEALNGGSRGWCCGCVQVQQQEQSCWVRFNLPEALKQNSSVVEAAANGLLVGAVQALGPCGWFDVACASPFSIEDDDMAILLQSHKTGFYAWDQADEDGTDRQADMQQLPWDMQPNTWQQQQQVQVQQQQQQQVPAAIHEESDNAMPDAQAEQHEQDQQPKLRMLVYIHFEQLLQALPWQLPQQLPLLQLPALASMPDIARHLAASRGAALWVHIDVCQLHGGHRLGSCVAPLSITGVAAQKLVFGALEQSVLVALYDPGIGKNSSRAVQDTSQQQQQQQHRRAGQEEDCELLLLGKERISGSGSSVGGSSSSSSGLLLQSAADVLLELVGRDEVMVDFALFNSSGALLMGRAGVEVWAKECVTYHSQQPCPPPQPGQQQGDATAAVYAAAQAGAAALAPGEHIADNAVVGGAVRHERTVHMLHFLVDGAEGPLWDNGLQVDAAPAPAEVPRELPLLRLELTWAALQGLFRPPPPPPQQQQQHSGAAVDQDSVYQVGDAMREMVAALRWL